MTDSRQRVLVVDDDRTLTDLLEMVLEDAGYAVTTAGNGREAVYAAVADPPDLVVLDVVMPEMDGWETCDHLLSHDRTATIPIIFLSARVEPEDQLRGWYKGCFDYLTKPFDIQELLGKVSAALTGPSVEIATLQTELRQRKIAALEQIIADAE